MEREEENRERKWVGEETWKEGEGKGEDVALRGEEYSDKTDGQIERISLQSASVFCCGNRGNTDGFLMFKNKSIEVDILQSRWVLIVN